MADLPVDPAFVDPSETSSDYGSEVASYTTSLASEVTNYKYLHGRRYHSYEEGRYVYPNDDQEKDRLDMMHEMVRIALGNKLFSAPVKEPQRVLDVGTGTGIWAIEFADNFPKAEVQGNDLSPIQPRWVPANLSFEVDDVEKPWTFSRPFDLIHCRGMYGAIRDWPALIASCFEHTAPGGYSEFTDWDSNLTSPDGSLKQDSSLKKLNILLNDHLEKAGTTNSPGPHLEKWVKDAGFEMVHVSKIPLPLGMWPKDANMKKIGALNYMQVAENVEGFSMYMLNMREGWQKEEVDVISAKVRAELKSKGLHSMTTLYNVVGRKPMGSKTKDATPEPKAAEPEASEPKAAEPAKTQEPATSQ